MFMVVAMNWAMFVGVVMAVPHAMAIQPEGETQAKPSVHMQDPFAPTLRFESGPVIDVVPGSVAVLIIDPEWKVRLGNSPAARLDDGRVLLTTHRRLVVSPSPAPPAWIADPGVWSTEDPLATPAGATRRDQRAFSADALAIELPLDGIGQGVWIGETRIGLNWLKTSPMLATLSTAEGLEWPATLTSQQRENQPLLKVLSPLSRSPMTRWRYRLLTDGLAPRVLPKDNDVDAGVQFEDPMLEALAQQQEASWRHGLAKIKQSGPLAREQDTGQLVLHHLSRLVCLQRDGQEIWLPAWVDDPAALSQLLGDLTMPSLAPAQASARARAHAELTPRLLAWGVDDAAVMHPTTGVGLPLIRALNLTARPMTISARIVDGEGRSASAGSDLILAPPDGGVEISSVASGPALNLRNSTQMVLESGVHKATVPVQLGLVDVTPPGLALSPFLDEWKQDDLVRDVPRARARPGLAATLSYRGSIKGDDGPDAPSGWVMLFERRVHARSAEVNDAESITLAWGPRQERNPQQGRLVVRRKAAVGGEGGDAGGSAALSRSVMDAEGNWYVEVYLPNAAIEKGGLMRLGVCWNDGTGARASWPRAMLPWDESLPRMPLNVSAW